MITSIHFLRTSCTDPYQNLAREELLWRTVQPGECILYLWQNRRTVVIGRNQDCWRECAVEALEASGGHLARRLSGGGAVYHDLGNLNFTFLVRKEDYDVHRQLSVVVEACRLLGIRAEVSGRNDLTVDGRKFSGNAFYESGGHCYHHGTLLLHADMGDLGKFLHVSPEKLASKGVKSVRSRVVNLRDFCPGLDVDQMCSAMTEAFCTVYGAQSEPFPAERLDERAVKERAAFYASDAWRLGFPHPSAAQLHSLFVFSRRFPWGDLQLYADTSGGILRGVRACSDAMDCRFISSLPPALEGIPYHAQEMARTVRKAGKTISAEMAEDIAQALEEAIKQPLLRGKTHGF